jgi:hypothetical protein
LNPGLEDLAHCSGRMPAKKQKNKTKIIFKCLFKLQKIEIAYTSF